MSCEIIENASVLQCIEAYPVKAAKRILHIRTLLIRLCKDSEDIATLQETFKWGEPSYVSNIGSTIRLAWKEKTPEYYYLYFICNTKLIDTFRELYADTFRFEGNRAIVFELDEDVPPPLAHCLTMALSYHKLKDLPLLGA